MRRALPLALTVVALAGCEQQPPQVVVVASGDSAGQAVLLTVLVVALVVVACVAVWLVTRSAGERRARDDAERALRRELELRRDQPRQITAADIAAALAAPPAAWADIAHPGRQAFGPEREKREIGRG